VTPTPPPPAQSSGEVYVTPTAPANEE
jgi:hypothetical protein